MGESAARETSSNRAPVREAAAPRRPRGSRRTAVQPQAPDEPPTSLADQPDGDAPSLLGPSGVTSGEVTDSSAPAPTVTAPPIAPPDTKQVSSADEGTVVAEVPSASRRPLRSRVAAREVTARRRSDNDGGDATEVLANGAESGEGTGNPEAPGPPPRRRSLGSQPAEGDGRDNGQGKQPVQAEVGRSRTRAITVRPTSTPAHTRPALLPPVAVPAGTDTVHREVGPTTPETVPAPANAAPSPAVPVQASQVRRQRPLRAERRPNGSEAKLGPTSSLPEPEIWFAEASAAEVGPITAPTPPVAGGPVGSAIIRAETAGDATQTEKPFDGELESAPAVADERRRRFGVRRTRGQPSQ